MAQADQGFYCLWQNDRIREALFEVLPKDDICNVRLASSACCNLVTKQLFLRTNLTFSASSFTRQSKIQALSRIGHHIEHLTFTFAHSGATFLPPLIHPESGREISFLYTPHTSMASVLERPKFANSGLGQILTEQYPPLFHAASNVPSFINAMKHMPNMRHLTIKTPGQDPKERYRRDIVDYALISLRIAMERAPMTKLNKLTLKSVHPSAFLYLRQGPGFGCTPSAGRRWKQIRKLCITVESWDFYGPAPGLDHLKLIEDYVRGFSGTLEKFTFAWLGRRGPCPVALSADPLFAPPKSSQKLFHEVTSPMSPLPPAPSGKPVTFSKVKYLSVRNATMNAPQVADLVAAHQHSVREYDFDNVVLINSGSWDDALAPLTENSSRSCHWSRYSSATMDEARTIRSETPAAEDLDDVPTRPSAAVAALADELLTIDLGDDDDDGEVTETPRDAEEDDFELPSDLESARKASLSFASKFKSRRITKHRRKKRTSHKHHDEEEANDTETSSGLFSRLRARQNSKRDAAKPTKEHRFRRHRPKISQDSIQSRHDQYDDDYSQMHQPSIESLRPREPPQYALQHYTSNPRLFGEVDSILSCSTQRLFGEVTPQGSIYGSEPDLYNSPTDDNDSMDEFFRPQTPTTPTPGSTAPSMDISAPIPNTAPNMPTLLQATVYDPTADLCSEISAVQRDIEAEEAQRILAEDPDSQTSALKRAKEMVLNRLGRADSFNSQNSVETRYASFQRRKESGGLLSSARLREGLFGKSVSVASTAWPDNRSMDVPILFSH